MRCPRYLRFALLVLLPSLALAQASAPPQAGTGQNPPEMASHEQTLTFRSRVDLVLVPVIVRDSKGIPIGNLHRDDFRVLDEGKPQAINYFFVETPETRAGSAKAAAVEPETAKTEEPDLAIPRRFLAYVFDDLHLNPEAITWARQAAGQQVSQLRSDERLALYTSSGRDVVDFTADAARLRAALLSLAPQPRVAANECPDLGPYWADLIDRADYNLNNKAVKDALAQMMRCPEQLRPIQMPDTLTIGTAAGPATIQLPRAGDTDYEVGTNQTTSAFMKGSMEILWLRLRTRQALAAYDQETRRTLTLLSDLVRRMSLLPGERTIVMVSPGFLTRELQLQLSELVDRAARANVVINSLDPRGVYTTGYDASENIVKESPFRQMFKEAEASMQTGALEELADGTGGIFFHGSNDLNEGFRRTAGTPEYTYMLGFAPKTLTGQTHSTYRHLKVTLTHLRNATVQARRGYFVAQPSADPAEAARQKVEAVMFSPDQVREIPLQVNADFFKTGARQAKLVVSLRVDLKKLPLRKVDGRNRDDLLAYTAIFDRNGTFIAGNGKTIEMRLRDETLAMYASGINLRTDFDLKSGSYLLRVVIRDSEGQLMSATNKAVQIP